MSTDTQIVTAERNAKLIVQDSGPIGYLMDTAKFEHCYRIAKLMACASLIPEHLRVDSKTKQPLPLEEVTANCFLVVNQSLRWNMDPFSVAPETYVVGGKLAYQGKLIAAVVNALAGLEDRLSYTFSGTLGKDDYTITVSGRFKGETAPRQITVSVGQAKTGNQMWQKDPEQKLVYTGATKWARRYCPEVVLGIILDDEYEPDMRNVTPKDELKEHLAIERIPTATAEVVTEPKRVRPAPKPAAAAPVEASQEIDPTPPTDNEPNLIEPTPEELAAAKELRDRIVKGVGAIMKAKKLKLDAVESGLKDIGWLGHDKLSECTNEELQNLIDNPHLLDFPTAEAG